MSASQGHKHSSSVTQNHKAQLANAYNELGKELSSTKIRVVGNYNLGKVIGEGAYGKVRMGTHRLTSTRVAVKQIPKAMSASLTREIHHHRQLHHPHITQMYEVIATESSIWIVTELCCGGELFDYLAEKGRLGEDEAKVVFGQLCLAVAYLHEKGIVHRDLKLENVLLDERCRVKLGDFGFTREFERGAFMETFCGTTGYASPEMLQGKKYQGPEVDVWSLGIILYCLLTGTLPFDDDYEHVMREKIIIGDFDDPEWLSIESRDLIKNILQKHPTNRLTIPQILAHPWFTSGTLSYQPESPISLPEFKPSRSPSPDRTFTEANVPDSHRSSEASTLSASSDITFLSATSDIGTSTPTTPDDIPNDPFELGGSGGNRDYSNPMHGNSSEATLRKTVVQQTDPESLRSRMGRAGPETVVEEDQDNTIELSRPSLARRASSGAGSTKPPPVNPARTPVRTKRRSVSSIMSDPASPTEKSPTPLPLPQGQDLDFASLLSTPSPIIFSTPLERDLLNTLSMLGFDMGQIVHSVLSNACDAAGALWWMLQRKAEKKSVGESGQTAAVPIVDVRGRASNQTDEQEERQGRGNQRVAIAVQTDPSGMHLSLARSAPQLAFVPATPTNARPSTPPRPVTPARSPMLSPSSSTVTGESSSRSLLSTPSGSFKDRDASKGRKARSGSVSIMQRATTALEAAGLVRKKSSEGVRDEKEKDREREREKSKEIERRNASGEEPRNSHGSSSSKLTKSPPLKSSKEYTTPSTPPPNVLHQPQPHMGSPWVLTESRDSIPHHTRASAPTPANSPGETIPMPTSGFGENINGKAPVGPHRNRANLLTAFRLWFNEDRKGKRKEANPPSSVGGSRMTYGRPVGNSSQPFNNGSVKRRTSGSGGKFASRAGRHRAHRPSVSSRRSSSVNSRRSSTTSAQMIMLDSPPVQGRRSLGTHTPNSERGDFSSRPSSIRSFSMQRHRKSPSASSAGSTHFRTASPMQKYHRRAGSGSSTRVVRQVQTTKSAHMRSGSAASSIHSPTSSRPASYYEPSESEGPRTISPLKSRSKRSADDPYRGARQNTGNTTFVAQKRSGPFMSPVAHSYGNAIGRSSWKKSWGLEPPGWQSRTAHLPIEVLSISPAMESPSIRDVFSGRHSFSAGDESDWVDEDDDIPAFAGGLGQMATSASSPSTLPNHVVEPTVTLSPAPRGHRSTKRTNRNAGPPSGSVPTTAARQKSGHSPAERTSPVPMDNAYETPETRGGRRQLPPTRSGPAFRGHAIQEEDEGEEE